MSYIKNMLFDIHDDALEIMRGGLFRDPRAVPVPKDWETAKREACLEYGQTMDADLSAMLDEMGMPESEEKLMPVGNPDIGRIIGRIHVMTPYRDAIREVISCLAKPWSGYDRKTRRYVIAATIQQHKQNRAVFCDVTSGNLSMPEPRPRYWFRASDHAVIIRED